MSVESVIPTKFTTANANANTNTHNNTTTTTATNNTNTNNDNNADAHNATFPQAYARRGAPPPIWR